MSERRAVTKKMAAEHARSSRVRKRQVLTEVGALTGWHRDYARAALRNSLKLKVVRSCAPRAGKCNGAALMPALRICWAVEPRNWCCGVSPISSPVRRCVIRSLCAPGLIGTAPYLVSWSSTWSAMRVVIAPENSASPSRSPISPPVGPSTRGVPNKARKWLLRRAEELVQGARTRRILPLRHHHRVDQAQRDPGPGRGVHE